MFFYTMKSFLLLIFFIHSFILLGQSSQDWNEKLHHKVEGERVYLEKETDQPPRLVYDINGFNRFIARNLKMPDEKVPVREIICSAIIETDGSMSNIIVLNDVPESYKKEALRVLKLFQEPWYPAMKDKLPVRSQYIIPIVFNF